VRSEADSKCARNKKSFLFCRGEDQQEGLGEEGIYNVYPWKGEEYSKVLSVLIIFSHQSASKMNSSVRLLLVLAAAERSPAWAGARFVFFTSAERICLSWK